MDLLIENIILIDNEKFLEDEIIKTFHKNLLIKALTHKELAFVRKFKKKMTTTFQIFDIMAEKMLCPSYINFMYKTNRLPEIIENESLSEIYTNEKFIKFFKIREEEICIIS